MTCTNTRAEVFMTPDFQDVMCHDVSIVEKDIRKDRKEQLLDTVVMFCLQWCLGIL